MGEEKKTVAKTATSAIVKTDENTGSGKKVKHECVFPKDLKSFYYSRRTYVVADLDESTKSLLAQEKNFPYRKEV